MKIQSAINKPEIESRPRRKWSNFINQMGKEMKEEKEEEKEEDSVRWRRKIEKGCT